MKRGEGQLRERAGRGKGLDRLVKVLRCEVGRRGRGRGLKRFTSSNSIKSLSMS